MARTYHGKKNFHHHGVRCPSGFPHSNGHLQKNKREPLLCKGKVLPLCHFLKSHFQKLFLTSAQQMWKFPLYFFYTETKCQVLPYSRLRDLNKRCYKLHRLNASILHTWRSFYATWSENRKCWWRHDIRSRTTEMAGNETILNNFRYKFTPDCLRLS